MTGSIHDSGYKKLFANRTIFRQLIETFVLLEAELLNLYDQESDKQAVSLFFNWFKQLAPTAKYRSRTTRRSITCIAPKRRSEAC